MKMVVIGGTGLIGSKLVTQLAQRGHEAVSAAPSTGVNAITGEGLASSIEGADAVVDVTNAPSWDDQSVLDFFTTSTQNQLAAEKVAGVRHHVALSIVGADREPDSGYLRAKIAQETTIKESGMPYTIVRSTQFFEFIRHIAESAADGDTIRLTTALLQPIAAEDVVQLLCETTTAPATNEVIEIGGPETIALDELGRRALAHAGDTRVVVADPEAEYFGARIKAESFVPGANARLGTLRFDDWVSDATVPR